MKHVVRLPWSKVVAALPAVALIGAGTALAASGTSSTTDIVADSRPLVKVPDAPLQRLDAPVLPPLPALPPLTALPTPQQVPVSAAVLPDSLRANGIPARALEAYQRAAVLVNAADAACKIDWALIAAIGRVESNHGRYAGNGLDESGTVRPGIIGIPLNGANNTAVIKDTDGGAFDRDTAWDRAVGPMQFIPGTWKSVGVDANGDGVKNPQTMSDAATAAAVYLCSGPGDLTDPSQLFSAIKRYNQSDAYARQVIAIADGYRGGVTVLPAEAISDSQRNGTPFMPSGETQTMAHYDPALASKPAAKPAAKPAQKPAARPGSEPTAKPGSGGTSASGPSGSTSPTPSGTATTSPDATGALTGAVGGVTAPLTGSTPTAPAPTTSAPAPSSPLPLRVPLLAGGTCPSGYKVTLNLLGVPVTCTRI